MSVGSSAPGSASPGDAGTGARRAEVLARLGEVERELVRLRAELLALSPGEAIPRAHLLVQTCGSRSLVPTALVAEVVRLVEMTPLPSAPPQVLGTFVWRGRAAVAVDLGWYLGARREPPLEAHVLVFAGTRTFAVVVDEVRALIASPTLVSATADGAPDAWSAAGLVAGTCRVGDEIVPLLGLGPILAALDRAQGGEPA